MTRENQIKKAAEIIAYGCSDELKAALIQDFPELNESEDERIRKFLIKLVNDGSTRFPDGLTRNGVLAYLEKQKEQKPFNVCEQCPYYKDCPDYNEKRQEWNEDDIKKIRSEEYTKGFNDCLLGKQKGWNEEDEKMLSKIIKHFDWYDSDRFNAEDCKEAQDFLKSLRSQAKKEWDTHDKAIVNCIVCCLDGQFVPEAVRKQALEWFNKHRRDFLNSPSWKPSEEQMEALAYAINCYESDWGENKVLRSVINNLKKLM